MAQITYADKSTMNENSSIPATNKCQASDMNEIKSVVNENYNEVGDITTLTTTDKSSVVNAINETSGLLNGLVYTEVVTLASNITIKANSNYGSTQTKTITPRTGYTPIMVSLHNIYNRAVNLWYCNLASSTQINWNCSNNTSSQVTGVSIQVRVLYIKSSCVAA